MIKLLSMAALVCSLLIFKIEISFAQGPPPPSILVPQGFNYQAIARDSSGNPLANIASLPVRIKVLDGADSVYVETHVVATNQYGLFALSIGMGTPVFSTFSTIIWVGGSYSLKVEVDFGSGYLNMGTQPLLTVPFAMVAGSALTGGNTLDQAYDQGGRGAGRLIQADSGAVEITTSVSNAIGLKVSHFSRGVAIQALNNSITTGFSTIQSSTASDSTVVAAIVGNSEGRAWGLAGQVLPTGTAQSAIYGSNLRPGGGHGVRGVGLNGVVGETQIQAGYGVYGENFDSALPTGLGVGVAGNGYYGVLGQDRYLGGMAGAYGVFSNGDMGAAGLKSFMIDHPLDPTNKYLKHFSMESNEALNVYRGNVSLDNNGEATVQLPDYFDEININLSYNLTPVGSYAELYIKEKVNDNRFVIGGGNPNMEVSWTIFAERNDKYVQRNPEKRITEVEKRDSEKGKYLMPGLYGAEEDKAIFKSPSTGKFEQPVMRIAEGD